MAASLCERCRRIERVLVWRCMTMPTDIGIIDLMLGIPVGQRGDWYEFLKPQLREESKDYEFPAQYMFKDVPAPRRGRRSRRRRRSSRWTTTASSRAMVGCRASRRTDRHAHGPRAAPRPLLRRRTRSTRTRAWKACATSCKAYETLGIKAATAFPAGLPPAGADQRQAVLSRSTPSASSSTSRSACAPACRGPRVPLALPARRC